MTDRRIDEADRLIAEARIARAKAQDVKARIQVGLNELNQLNNQIERNIRSARNLLQQVAEDLERRSG